MLQLTFHAQAPCDVVAAEADALYRTLRSRDAAQRDTCLSITFTDLGTGERTRYRALFETLGASGSSIRVVTEATDLRVALRSGFAVVLGSRSAAERAQGAQASVKSAAMTESRRAVCS